VAHVVDVLPVFEIMAPIHFRPQHQSSVKNHILSGITLIPWLKIIFNRWKVIEWKTYWPRLLFLTFLSVFNTFLSMFDYIFYGSKIKEAKLNDSPVFILGHPRTGTTLLHNLLSLDPMFAFANTFHVGFPSSFLCMEKFKGIMSPLIDSTRPMDNMTLNFDVPQEDELATNVSLLFLELTTVAFCRSQPVHAPCLHATGGWYVCFSHRPAGIPVAILL
jgi:hypothetical protein